MKAASPKLVFALLIALAYTLGTCAHLQALNRVDAGSNDGAFKKLLGDGRRLFAGQFVEMADVYLHSGFYPSIFDRRDVKAPKAVSGRTADADDHDDHAHEGHKHDAEGKCVHHNEHQDEHEMAMDFMGKPNDWLEGFIRRFRITKHTHLENGEEREVLPWLKLAIELDPQAIETYTATAFWLRKNLGNAKDAEEVLREGMRNNPKSFEILFELGKLHKESHQDPVKAQHIWEAALSLWNKQTTDAKTASMKSYSELTINLARLMADAGNFQRAIQYFELAKMASPRPEAIQQQIDEIQSKINGPTTNSLPNIFPPL